MKRILMLVLLSVCLFCLPVFAECFWGLSETGDLFALNDDGTWEGILKWGVSQQEIISSFGAPDNIIELSITTDVGKNDLSDQKEITLEYIIDFFDIPFNIEYIYYNDQDNLSFVSFTFDERYFRNLENQKPLKTLLSKYLSAKNNVYIIKPSPSLGSGTGYYFNENSLDHIIESVLAGNYYVYENTFIRCTISKYTEKGIIEVLLFKLSFPVANNNSAVIQTGEQFRMDPDSLAEYSDKAID